jgi:Domain of unknown function (DUF4789)
MQGPCPPGQILILPKNSAIPVCVQNRCPTNFVKYRHQNGTEHCERLEDPEPCLYLNTPKPYVIGVNETTLEVACVPMDRNNNVGQETTIKISTKKRINGVKTKQPVDSHNY